MKQTVIRLRRDTLSLNGTTVFGALDHTHEPGPAQRVDEVSSVGMSRPLIPLQALPLHGMKHTRSSTSTSASPLPADYDDVHVPEDRPVILHHSSANPCSSIV